MVRPRGQEMCDMANDRYLRYDSSIEQQRPGEKEVIDKIVASIERTGNNSVTHNNGHGIRQQHARGVGYLRGELTVNDALPDHLRQGLFARPGRYPVIVRYSTAFPRGDRVRAPRGMAIKVLGVTGDKALPDDASANQDFLLVNHVSYFSDAWAYLGAQKQVESNQNRPDLFFRVGGAVARVWVAAYKATGLLRPPQQFKALADPGNNLLGETFHSQGAVRFGEYVARLRAVPLTAAMLQLTGQPCHDNDTAVSEAVSKYFSQNGAEYELRAQLCTDLERTPVEDASIDWPEDVSPSLPIGRISLPAQVANSEARTRYVDNVLSFDPWRCLADHRPLGSIMRLRRDAYGMSRKIRQQNNPDKPPPGEPQDLTALPN
jgi:hypothetical protein